MAQARIRPVEKCPAQPARVGSGPESLVRPIVVSAKGQRLVLHYIEFRNIERATFFISVPPDEEDLVGRAEGVDLKLRVSIAAVDEDLSVILQKNQRAGLGLMSFHVRLFQPHSDV